MKKLPKLVLTDIDGVWTDGGMYYSNDSNELKKFNTSDSAGILFCKTLNIPVAIITGEETQIVKNRAKKLGISRCYTGIKDKVEIANQLREELDLDWSEIAFIGDDINDLKLLKMVGFAASVANAPKYVQTEVHFVTQKNGGEGAFREFIEFILMENNLLDGLIEAYK